MMTNVAVDRMRLLLKQWEHSFADATVVPADDAIVVSIPGLATGDVRLRPGDTLDLTIHFEYPKEPS